MNQQTEQYSTFSADGLMFGVAVESVQEVVRHQEMTPVPLAHYTVHGLINLRGQIITAVDLRACLGLEKRPTESQPMNVVLRVEQELTSLLVDEIGDVLNLDPGCFEEPPATLPEALKKSVVKVCKLERCLMLVIDPERLMN